MEEDKIEYPKELRDRVKQIIDLDKSISYHRNLYSSVTRFSNESVDEIAKAYHKNIRNAIEKDITKLKLLLYGREEI